MDDLYARFNPNPNKIAAWARLLMLSDGPSSCSSAVLSTPSPDELYARAIPTLLQMKDDLLRLGWSQIPPQAVPVGLLFVVESPKPAAAAGNLWDAPQLSPSEPRRLSSPCFVSTSAESRSSFFHDLARSCSDPVRFALPADLSGFLEFRQEMEEALHNPALFRPMLDHRGNLVLASSHEPDPLNSPPLKNIFHLLQLIVPGMFLLIHDSLTFNRETSLSLRIPESRSSGRQSRQGTLESMGSTGSTQVFLRRTRRALPPAEWISNRMEVFETIFGKHHLHDLVHCARDVELTVWRTVHGPEDQMDSGYVKSGQRRDVH